MKTLFTLCMLIGLTVHAQQRELQKPEASQQASVMQRIGLTDISISYHSPLAKGRTIWGEVVPYNEVWRAGANDNTVITFSTDVKVEGKALAAGTYGLHMIPTPKDWTVIFSKNSSAWGSFFYNEKEDALRVTVKPVAAEMQDWLSYSFADPKPDQVSMQLRWEKLMVPVNISAEVHEIVLASMKAELTHISGFFWSGYNQAAAYCIKNNIHLDQAAEWVDKSISMQKNFTNLNTKSSLLAKQGKTQEADALKKEAVALADEAQLNMYGYELLGQGKNAEAIEIFKMNVKRYPASWNVYDSLAEGQEKSGDVKNATANYKLALAKAPEGQKDRINKAIDKLSGLGAQR
jgi:hypothetical protein